MRVAAFAFGLALTCAPALAETADFLGNWVTRDGNGIGRVVIAPAEGDRATIRIHSTTFHPEDITTVDGIPVTSVARVTPIRTCGGSSFASGRSLPHSITVPSSRTSGERASP